MSLNDKVQHKAGVELSGGPFVKSYILEEDVKQSIEELKEMLKQAKEKIEPTVKKQYPCFSWNILDKVKEIFGKGLI